MKSFYFIVILFSMWTSLTDVHAQANAPDWENPEIFAVNAEKTRATSIPYADERTAIADEYERSPYFQSLNGTWKFHWVPKVEEVPSGFFNENYDDSAWEGSIATFTCTAQTIHEYRTSSLIPIWTIPTDTGNSASKYC